MIVLSAKKRNSLIERFRFFFGGMILIVSSLSTLYVSSIYNHAIATKNTELIENAVIVLFITDLDEMLHRVLMTINSSWVTTKGAGDKEKSQDDRIDVLTSENTEMKDKLKEVQTKMEKLSRKIEEMQEHNLPKETLGGAAQDEGAKDAHVDFCNKIIEGPEVCSGGNVI